MKVVDGKRRITKDIITEAVMEAIERKRDIFVEAIEESIENIVMKKVIDEGLKGKYVKEEEVLKILQE